VRARTLTHAVRAGDLAKAKRLYGPARISYERIEPVAESFGSLDPAIDARANDVAPGQRWTAFHRIEQALWAGGTTHGMARYADQLDEDIRELEQKVDAASYQPAQLANGAVELLNEVSKSKITGEEERYSHTDLVDFQANVDGARQAFVLLRPVDGRPFEVDLDADKRMLMGILATEGAAARKAVEELRQRHRRYRSSAGNAPP